MAAPMDGTSHDEFPIEIRDRMSAFDTQLTKVENEVNNFTSTPISEIHEKLSLIEKAKVDLIAAYSINSLFWTFLVARGEDPRETAVKDELARIQSHMKRAREIEQELKDKEKALKVDRAAAKRFVVGALGNQLSEDNAQAAAEENIAKAKKNLWKKAHQKPATNADTSPPVVPQESPSPSSEHKRKASSPNANAGGKKKKKKKK